ncbi:MAG: Cas10/Cmr2 second palm domain-containing protein [Thermoanaerobaculia bacterium]
MSQSDALLTFSIGPVHTFIAQARRVADLWAGSSLLSHLIKIAIREAFRNDADLLFPYVEKPARVGGTAIPDGLPNRFVCRVDAVRATSCAQNMAAAVRGEWNAVVAKAVAELAGVGLEPDRSIRPGSNGQRSQTDAVLDIAWSWVPETGGYRAASDAGARQFAASRMFRPFLQISEPGLKCAVCGERTALPNGRPKDVRDAWDNAEKRAHGERAGFFRADQTRLCLVCSTKRLFPLTQGQGARFSSFKDFEPPIEDDTFPYFAVVAMDGDNLGKLLAGSNARSDSALEEFHRKVSETLTAFANSLRTDSPTLNLATLNEKQVGAKAPQLIYAGGEDVLFICDAREAIPLARAVRERYKEMFATFEGSFTISAGVLFAHTKYPAGLLFREVDDLLARKAKAEAGRDAIAIRLNKRGGVPVEVAFRWDDVPAGSTTGWLDLLQGTQGLVTLLRDHEVASRQTYLLAEDADLLATTFGGDAALWTPWLRKALSRGEAASGNDEAIAEWLTPVFIERRTPLLRIARFLAVEVPS